MKVAVTVGIFNEESNVRRLLDALERQTRPADEIIIVDDGSTDGTAEAVREYSSKNPSVKYTYQDNAGPAAARNRAWQSTHADICIFTDGDCVPSESWVDELLKPLSDPRVGAVGGTYYTMNCGNALARFIGLEIAWRYRNVPDGARVDVHGSYSLAVRRGILQEIGGFNEDFKAPSGEDWDMSLKISAKYELVFAPKAVTGHFHPESFFPYLGNQMRRAFDRVKVYMDHPQARMGDSYTGLRAKYQAVLGGALLLTPLILVMPFSWTYLVVLAMFVVSLILSADLLFYVFRQDFFAALVGVPIILCRSSAWFIGFCKGVLRYGPLGARRMRGTPLSSDGEKTY